jgi:hypothetical protein
VPGVRHHQLIPIAASHHLCPCAATARPRPCAIELRETRNQFRPVTDVQPTASGDIARVNTATRNSKLVRARRGTRLTLMALAGIAAYGLAVRARLLSWGATDKESDAPLLGDDLIAVPDLVATRAITIRATADEVWPWIAQLGQGRGGFYSYDFLENLVGCDIHSADRIVSEWQDVAVGDEVKLFSDGPLRVAALKAGRSLVIRGGVPMGNIPPPYDFTWAFALREQPNGTTRLVVRERYAYSRWWAALLVEPAAAISFVMTRKMLRGIRDRAERPAAPVGSLTRQESGQPS